MNIYAILSLFSAIFISAYGVFIYTMSARNKNTAIFLLLTIGVAFLNFSQFHLRITNSFENALLWSKAYSIWPVVLAIKLHFSFSLKENKYRSILFYLSVYLPAVILFYLQFATNIFVLPPIEQDWGWTIQYNFGLYNNISMAIGLIYWGMILATLISSVKSKTGIIKKQVKLVLTGIIIYFLGILIFDDILPQIDVVIPELGNIIGSIAILFVGYGIWRYNVTIFDSDSVTSKLFSSISNYLLLVDSKNIILEVNDKLLDLLQYTYEEVAGNRMDNFINVGAQTSNPLLNSTLSATEFSNEKLTFVAKNGDSIDLLFSASRVKISNHSQSCLVYIGTQMVPDSRNQKLIEENKRNTQFLAEAALDMFLFQTKADVYHYITEHTYNLLNKEAIIVCAEFNENSENIEWEVKSITGINMKLMEVSKILGFDPGKMKSFSLKSNHSEIKEGKLTSLALDFDKLTSGLISNQIGNKIKSLLGIMDLKVISIQHGRQMFGTLSILSKKNAPEINNGLIESLMAIASLVLNRQHAEFELSRSEKLFRSIVESSQISIFIFNKEGILTLLEGAEYKKFGVDPNLVTGESIHKIAEKEPYIIELVERALRGEVFSAPFSFKEYHFNLTFTPFYNEDGEISGTLGMSTDITPQVQSELRLKELNEMRSKLISIIGHDLKGSISNVVSFSDLILNEYKTHSENEILEMMKLTKKSAINASTILNGLTNWYNSIEESNLVCFDQFEVKELVSTTIEHLSAMAEHKKITIIEDISNSISVIVDKNMVLAVFRNLLLNSIKFTEPGGTITIWDKKEIDKYFISFTDTGIGISRNKLESLFDFGMVIATEGTKGEQGSGLGLQICKNLMDRNAGSISAESELGKGSTFTLTFPLTKGSSEKKN